MPSANCKSVQDYVTILIECFLVCAPVFAAVKFLRERFQWGARFVYVHSEFLLIGGDASKLSLCCVLQRQSVMIYMYFDTRTMC